MKDACIVNCTFGEPYDEYQPRLLASLDKYWKGPRITWTNCLPSGAPPHSVSPFGFKLHAIQYARESGFNTVVWLDGGGYLIGPIDELLRKTFNTGYYAVEGYEPIYRWVSDEALHHLGETRQGLKEKGWKLFGGTPYAFDFTKDVTKEFFRRWWRAMQMGMFKHISGDSKTDFHGHRHDEAIATILFHQMGMIPSKIGEFYGGDEKESAPTVVIKSGDKA